MLYGQVAQLGDAGLLVGATRCQQLAVRAKRTLVNAKLACLKGSVDGILAGCVPHACSAVASHRRQPPPVSAVRNVVDLAVVALERLKQVARASFPDTDLAIVPSCSDGSPVWSECEACHGI